MTYLRMGVVGTAYKENEQRAPIHPEHLDSIPEVLRQNMYFETGYGGVFWCFRQCFGKQSKRIMFSRENFFESCDVVLLPKPTSKDFSSFKEGQIIWGWPHCVQGPAITQEGIDKKLTYIAWEEMHVWGSNGQWLVHVFHINNELAGYCSVKHALQLRGMTGHYGPNLKAVVIGFGSVGRGAIHLL